MSCWILKDFPKTNIFILKGDCVFDTKKSHDIILVNQNDKLFLLDPSIWQFFGEETSILIGEVKNIKETIKLAEETYKGKWKVSEEIKNNICEESEELEKIIKSNAQEN